MKNLSVFPLIAMSVVSAVAAPVVDNVVIEQNAATHGVAVSYDLSENAIVTVDFLTNDVPCESAQHVNGDTWRLVLAGTGRKIAWDMAADLGAENKEAYSVQARVSAWTTDSPPTYFVLDLVAENAVTRRRYYEHEGQLPGGIGSDVYRTTKMVFRRIPAGGATFVMGSPAAEWNKLASKASSIGLETQHNVAFTEDFYMGVFEVTQAQWSRVYGSLPAQGYAGDGAALCPVANVSTWNEIRCNESDCGSWPQDGRYPQNTHFLGKLRKLAGGTEADYPNHSGKKTVTGCGYDIPLEAQWEFACRAGTTTAFNNGQDITDTTSDPALDEIAWYANTSQGHVHPVGRLKANAWGLYDMHGNVAEWVRDTVRRRGDGDDWYKQDRTDPEGDNYQGYRCKRGGHYNDTAFYSRSALRNAGSYGGVTEATTGFRVSCPVDEL